MIESNTWAAPPEDLKCIHCGHPIEQYYDTWIHSDTDEYMDFECRSKIIVVKEKNDECD